MKNYFTEQNFHFYLHVKMESDDTPQLPGAPAILAGGSKSQVEDLFSAHDFDIQIDLPSSNEGNVAEFSFIT